jgi:transglutaminase-like putative cysteine protease
VGQARQLAAAHADKQCLARATFEFVRDQISHSGDVRADVVTCRASEVLAQGTGWCFGKSHLLAVLLRANGIAAGLCYQRLAKDAVDGEFTLHGLNAVWLDDFGWYRCDARGDKPGVSTAFAPPEEYLAWPGRQPGEVLFSAILPRPLPVIVNYLQNTHGWQAAIDALPDAETLPW